MQNKHTKEYSLRTQTMNPFSPTRRCSVCGKNKQQLGGKLLSKWDARVKVWACSLCV